MRAAFFFLIALALAVSLTLAEKGSPKGPQEERGTFKNKRGVVIATREWRSYEDELGSEGKPISAVVREAVLHRGTFLEVPASFWSCRHGVVLNFFSSQVVMLHGLGWHSGYFSLAAKTIVEAGFAVAAMVCASRRRQHPLRRPMHHQGCANVSCFCLGLNPITLRMHMTFPRLVTHPTPSLAVACEQDLQGHGMSKSASNEPRGYTAKLSNHVDDIEQFIQDTMTDE